MFGRARDRRAIEEIEAYQRRMKEGMRVKIDARTFEAAFPPMDYNGVHWTSVDRFMENQVGSAYGTWRCWENFDDRSYTIERGSEGTERVWTSPDRR